MTSSFPSRSQVALASGVSLAVGAGAYYLWRERREAERIRASQQDVSRRLRVRVLYGSTAGNTESWANRFAADVAAGAAERCSLPVEVVVHDLKDFLFDSLLEAAKDQTIEIVVVLLSTHTDGLPPPNCEHFVTLLEDHVHDFRVSQNALAHVNFAVLGFGSAEYEAAGAYCTAAARVDSALASLAGRRLVTLRKVTDTEDAAAQVNPWTSQLSEVLCRLPSGLPAAAPAAKADAPQEEGEEDSESDSDESDTTASGGKDVAEDLEDMASSSCTPSTGKVHDKEMLTTRMRAQLTKEGYKLIGGHSAVKLCRWTKHQLRGRGGCYKHSFYGITSYQCMEATPSLACANKCTFCWRHHKNPVGKEWKWRMDPPEFIVAEGVELHRKMIRECKGIPGVREDRFKEAMHPRHCALSLVGEPIMYPKINELVDELHRRRISTFLVTNAQFPDAIENLHPVTQLYVSVDGGNKESLKAIDRPLFTDFWERYNDSLKALAAKKQRTTYRLTLVKGQNCDEVADYAKLVALGNPDFIEIKSVTFCGESKASSMSMGNVPWHEEVKTFAEGMLSHEGLESQYELACEHQHSCIVLISHKRFKIDGRWNTWIDYEKFHDLVAEGKEFTALDYALPTPEWAVYGSDEAGFDPLEKRVYHNRTKRKAKEGLLSEAQLAHYPKDHDLLS